MTLSPMDSDIETLFLGESDPEDDCLTWDIRRDVPCEMDLWNPNTGHPRGPQNHPETGPLAGLSKWQPLGTKRMQRRQGAYVTGDMGGSYLHYKIDSVKVVGRMTYFHMVYHKRDYHMLIRSNIAGDLLGLVYLTYENDGLCIKVVNAVNRDWVMWLGKFDTPTAVTLRHVAFKTHRFLGSVIVIHFGFALILSPLGFKCFSSYYSLFFIPLE